MRIIIITALIFCAPNAFASYCGGVFDKDRVYKSSIFNRSADSSNVQRLTYMSVGETLEFFKAEGIHVLFYGRAELLSPSEGILHNSTLSSQEFAFIRWYEKENPVEGADVEGSNETIFGEYYSAAHRAHDETGLMVRPYQGEPLMMIRAGTNEKRFLTHEYVHHLFISGRRSNQRVVTLNSSATIVSPENAANLAMIESYKTLVTNRQLDGSKLQIATLNDAIAELKCIMAFVEEEWLVNEFFIRNAFLFPPNYSEREAMRMLHEYKRLMRKYRMTSPLALFPDEIDFDTLDPKVQRLYGDLNELRTEAFNMGIRFQNFAKSEQAQFAKAKQAKVDLKEPVR